MPTLTMPTRGLPGLVRAALGARRAELVPAPRPPVPAAFRRALPATVRPVLPVVADPDPAPSCGPQAQGDLIVLPWPEFMSPHVRFLHTGAAQPVPVRGLVLLDPHVLLAETGRVFWSPWTDPGPTLGTVVVPAGMVARIGHDTHRDLRIGPGVYAVRRQRREVCGRIELALD